MINEFKQFIMRGNVLDMAVGIIIGGAFGKIVASMVSDVLMPVIGLILGKINFSNLFFDLSGTKPASVEAAKAAGAATLNYGLFISSIVDFLIIAFIIFLIIKQVNRLMPRKVEAPPPPAAKDCPRCLSQIPIKATRCAHCTSDV
ncbi:MAG: large conductance mechanosensitive channel protein MscL [Desulfobacterales bacterium]|nr:large conductance mechanosensitive channel protein MscL [Desulfobacterales bacterium]